MRKLRTLSLFAGIGGFDLGLEQTGGFETVAFCEIDPFCQEVLAKHWPNVPCFSDVRELRGDQVGDIDVICGGFPCQDLSTAGKQAGMGEGTRSGLWSEIVRLAGELRPSFIIVENVAALLRGPSEQPGRWFGRVLGDLVALGYDAEWHCIPASYIGARHRRDRVWILAYPARERCGETGQHSEQSAQRIAERSQVLADAAGERQSRSRKPIIWRGIATAGGWQADKFIAERFGTFWAVEPDVGRVANGVPRRVDRLRSLGNAVVPQIPELIGHAILEDLEDQGAVVSEKAPTAGRPKFIYRIAQNNA